MTNEEFRAQLMNMTRDMVDNFGKITPVLERLTAQNLELKARVEKLEAQPMPGTAPVPVTGPAGAANAGW
jgi:hypothetical protein